MTGGAVLHEQFSAAVDAASRACGGDEAGHLLFRQPRGAACVPDATRSLADRGVGRPRECSTSVEGHDRGGHLLRLDRGKKQAGTISSVGQGSDRRRSHGRFEGAAADRIDHAAHGVRVSGADERPHRGRLQLR